MSMSPNLGLSSSAHISAKPTCFTPNLVLSSSLPDAHFTRTPTCCAIPSDVDGNFKQEPVTVRIPAKHAPSLDQKLSVLHVQGIEILNEGEALLSGQKRPGRQHDDDLEVELGSQSEHSNCATPSDVAGSFKSCYVPTQITSFLPEPVPTSIPAKHAPKLDKKTPVEQVQGIEIVMEKAHLSGQKRRERQHDNDLEAELGSQSDNSSDCFAE